MTNRFVIDVDAAVAAAVAPLAAELAELRRRLEALSVAASADDLLSVAEAAKVRNITVAAMRKQVQRGNVPSVRRGRSVLVRRGDLV